MYIGTTSVFVMIVIINNRFQKKFILFSDSFKSFFDKFLLNYFIYSFCKISSFSESFISVLMLFVT